MLFTPSGWETVAELLWPDYVPVLVFVALLTALTRKSLRGER